MRRPFPSRLSLAAGGQVDAGRSAPIRRERERNNEAERVARARIPIRRGLIEEFVYA